MKRLYMIILSVLGSIGIAIAISYAWFLNDTNVNPIAEGSSGAAYFAYGNGTSSKPYGINNKRHLYNFAWLTYLYPNDYNNLYYEIDPNLSSSLDMDNMVLPPIGKDNHPFTGYFNGNGKTITNLTTSNSLSDMSVKPNNVASILNTDQSNLEVQNNLLTKATNIGFFGSISSGKIYDFYLNNTKVQTKTSTTCIGTVAGYVNGTIEDVGVIAPHLNIQTGSAAANATKTTNLSDFAVVGYAEEAYTTQKTKSSTIIYNPTYSYNHFNYNGMGEQTEWGGSIDMKKMFNRIGNFISVASTNPTGANKTLRIMDKNTFVSETTTSNRTMSNYNSTSYYYKEAYMDDHNNAMGAYFTWDQNASYKYLFGTTKDVIQLTISEEKDGITISDSNSHFLNRNNLTVSAGNNSNATVWLFDSGAIYTYVSDRDVEPSDGINRLYLNSDNSSLSLSNLKTTTWGWDDDYSTFKYTHNGVDYGIVYENGFKVSILNRYRITDGAGHYLAIRNNNLIDTTVENDATIWIFSNNGTYPSGTISTIINGTTYYLYYNNGLTLSTSSTIWSNSGTGIYYGNNYIYCRLVDSNEYGWLADDKYSTSYSVGYISDNNNNYLSFSSDGRIVNQNSINNATRWCFETVSTNPSGYIFSISQGISYYLSYDNGLTLTTSRNTAWSNSNSQLIYSGNYIQFRDNKWIASSDISTNIRYRITDGAGNYLSISGLQIVNETNEDDAIGWTFSDLSGLYPTGYISTIIGGSTYYLKSNNNSLSLSLTSTTWVNNGTGIYNGSEYIRFNESSWILTSQLSETRYLISDGKGNYLSLDGTSICNETNQSNAVKWIFSNYSGTGTISTYINGTIYYLNYNSGLVLSTTSTNWQNNSGKISYNGYYIQYSPDSSSQYSWIASNEYFYISSGSNYLSHSGTNISNQTNISNATLWHFTNGGTNPSGYVQDYGYSNSRYVRPSNGSLSYSTTSTSLSNSSNQLYRSSYYIYYNNSWTGARNYGTTLTFVAPTLTLSQQNISFNDSYTSTGYSSTYSLSYVDELFDSYPSLSDALLYKDNYGIYYDEELTRLVTRETMSEGSIMSYIPLNTSDDTTSGEISNTNTGYLLSGAQSSNGSGLVRVSRYDQDNIGESYSNGSFGTIYTIQTNGNSYSETAIDDNNNSYVKYNESRRQLLSTLSSETGTTKYVYGLHFMNSALSIDNTFFAPNVSINGTEYSRYQMPNTSIDFHLKSRGLINFFSGAYFQDNSAFFSLHQIERDSYNRLVAVNHIYKIYKKDNEANYIYELVDASHRYSASIDGEVVYYDSLPSGYNTLVFDSNWIENPSIVLTTYTRFSSQANFSKKLFYFEIPVDAGEYALGSVDNKTGAYLIYLDIGANAAPVDRTIITQRTDTTKDVLKYVNGIQILATGASFTNDSNTAVAYITTSNANAANNNDISITRSGNTITIANATLKSWYYDEGITLSGATIDPVSNSLSVSNVLRFVDYNRSTQKLYYTTIYNDGEDNVSYDCFRIDNIATNAKTEITDRTSKAEWGLLKIVDGLGVSSTITDSAFNFSTSTTTKILDYYSYILTSNVSQLTDTNDMVIVDDSANYLPAGGIDYTYERAYKMTGNTITMTPNDLLVYFGPTLKNSVTVSGPTSNVATVTITVGGTLYTFTFNADAIDNTNKTVTIYVSA